MHRILIPIDSQGPESWQYALAYAQKIGEQQNNPTDIVLLVHTTPTGRATSSCTPCQEQ